MKEAFDFMLGGHKFEGLSWLSGKEHDGLGAGCNIWEERANGFAHQALTAISVCGVSKHLFTRDKCPL